ncbi:MAG TPA: PAS domain S-box protein [Gemmatimonadaceae bacterium]|nr:PAS domain S-box protein [Gemmatimonadaceae bacterium]
MPPSLPLVPWLVAGAALALAAGLALALRGARRAARDAELHRLVTENVVDLTCVFDESRRLSYVSPSARLVLGYAPEALIAMHRAPVHPDERPLVEEAVAAMLAGERRTFLFRMRHADGRWLWLESDGGPLVDGHGRRIGICTVARDVTKRVRAESALRESEVRLRLLVARAGYGVFRATHEGEITEANEVLAALLGQPDAAALCGARLPEAVLAVVRASTAASVGDDTPGWVEARWARGGGTFLDVRLAARAVRDDAGRPRAYEAFVEDVTEQRRRDELLRRTQRLASLGRMLAGTAHELNNPLAAICGFAQLLLRGTRLRGEDREAVETIEHEARRAAAIVRDLLTFSRRQNVGERQRVDLNAVASYIAQSRRYALETSGVQLSLELTPGPVEVMGDTAQLEQVVLNLLANAAESLEGAADRDVPRGVPPRIVVRTLRREGLALLEVADNGPGVAEADLPYIWDPFYTRKAASEGTGLGLAVVHRLVTDHGGAVDLERGGGPGARFRVALPAAPPPDVAEPPPMPDDATAPRALDVLVLDRAGDDAQFVARFLGARGHAVLVARDGDQALRLATRNGCDVLLVDRDAADGALLARLRANAGCAGARVVVTTTGDPDDAQQALGVRVAPDVTDGCAVQAVLVKPFDVAQLRRAVEAG